MSRKRQKLLIHVAAVLGGLVLGLALCATIPVAWAVAAWRWRRGGHLFFRRATATGGGGDDDDGGKEAPLQRSDDGEAPHLTITIGADSSTTSSAAKQHPQQHQQPPFLILSPASFSSSSSPPCRRGADLDQLLLPLFREHGTGALAFSSLLNPEFSHFYVLGAGSSSSSSSSSTGHENEQDQQQQQQGSLAFVAAERYGVSSVMAVGDPLAPRAAWPRIARLFIEAHEGIAEAFFCYCSRDFAECVSRDVGRVGADGRAAPKFAVNDWGLSTRVRLPPLGFKHGPGSRSAQQDARRALKSGLSVVDVAPAALSPEQRAAMREVSSECRAQKVTEDRELRVFCRALDLLGEGEAGQSARRRDQEAGVRVFLAERAAEEGAGKRVVDGFAVLDPQCEGGRVVGYVLSSSRARRAAHRGTLKLLAHHVMASGALRVRPPPQGAADDDDEKTDDKNDDDCSGHPLFVDLGLAPFAGLDDPTTCPFDGGAAWMRLTARFLFRVADRRLYSFSGLAQSKARYGGGEGGEQQRVYCVHRRPGWLPGLFLAELYVLMVFVGFCGDGVLDSVVRLWGWRRK